MIGWAWRIASRRGLRRPVLRVLATILAVPASASILAMVHPSLAWPTGAGLGGAGGHLLSGMAVDYGTGALG
ncbi:DNA translocase FtsK 4TM domain-containing protein, partial [Escherichia coli]|uniref:DNA translocase FtsK 4TM domain-containing protein n=1 Tax=Escherichia coli TaxID=562 RepID=UPI001932B003